MTAPAPKPRASFAHQKASPDWGTPPAIVEMAREVMDGIDCDPCSSSYWNAKGGIRAVDFYDERSSALTATSAWFMDEGRPIYRTFFINPPGGMVKEFWQFATARWQEGSAVFWVGFSLEQLLYLGRAGIFHRGIARAVPFQRLAYLESPRGRAARLLERATRLDAKEEWAHAADLRIEANRLLQTPDAPPLVGPAPTHGSYLALLPSAVEQVERFHELARQLPAEVF